MYSIYYFYYVFILYIYIIVMTMATWNITLCHCFPYLLLFKDSFPRTWNVNWPAFIIL